MDLTSEQADFVVKVMRNCKVLGGCAERHCSDSQDWLEWRCGFSFVLVSDYLPGTPGHYHPRDFAEFQKALLNAGSGVQRLKEMEKEDSSRNYPKWFVKSFARDLISNPVASAFVLGLDRGAGAVYDGSSIAYPKNRFFRREVPASDIELAVLSGAVFGDLGEDTIEEMFKRTKAMLKQGFPVTLRQHAQTLFLLSYGKDDDVPADYKETERYKIFEEKLFEIAVRRSAE